MLPLNILYPEFCRPLGSKAACSGSYTELWGTEKELRPLVAGWLWASKSNSSLFSSLLYKIKLFFFNVRNKERVNKSLLSELVFSLDTLVKIV